MNNDVWRKIVNETVAFLRLNGRETRYSGTVRADPAEREVIVVAGLKCYQVRIPPGNIRAGR